MILELITMPLFAVLTFIINCFPLLAFPVDVAEGLFSLLDLWNDLERFIPVNYALILIGTYWVIVNGKLFIAIISWIYEKIPFLG